MEKGLRYNKGKNRIELIPAKPIEHLGEVYTRGAHKYSKYKKEDGTIVLGKDISVEDAIKLEMVYSGADNWRKGLSWTEAIGSVERHINAFKQGEDIDTDLGTYHLANAAWGLFSLLEFYNTHPEMDDRNHKYLKPKRIALDVDDVCVSWVNEWCKLHEIPTATCWYFQYGVAEKFEEMRKAGTLDEFYANLPALIEGKDLPIEPICYISHRPVSKEVTEAWLVKHQFPLKPVFITPTREDKLQVCIDNKIDIFIDDNYDTFVHLNSNGICCLLMDTPHNQRYQVGYKRIKNFTDFKKRFL